MADFIIYSLLPGMAGGLFGWFVAVLRYRAKLRRMHEHWEDSMAVMRRRLASVNKKLDGEE